MQSYQITLNFRNNKKAKETSNLLNDEAAKAHYDLYEIFNNLSTETIESTDEITVEEIKSSKNSVLIDAYSGRTEVPQGLTRVFTNFEANSSIIDVYYDEGNVPHYFIGDKSVSLQEYVDFTKGSKNGAIKSSLILPEGRIKVEAKVISYEWKGNANGDYCVIKFKTKDNQEYFYQGDYEKIIAVLGDEYEQECTFHATIEEECLEVNSPPVAVVKRLSKIELSKINPIINGLGSLRGENKRFHKKLGLITVPYFEEYGGDANKYFMTICKDSFLGIPFADLISACTKSKEDYFSAFGMDISISQGKPSGIDIECTNYFNAIDPKQISTNFQSKGFDCISNRFKNGAYETVWKIDKLEFKFFANNHKASLSVKIISPQAKTPPMEQYLKFMDNPGVTTQTEWLNLFESAKDGAESGDIDSMLTLSMLYQRDITPLKRNTSLSREWHVKAGELGDTSVYLLYAKELMEEGKSDEEFIKGMGFLKKGALLSNSVCWDQYERNLKFRPERLNIVQKIVFPNIDKSYWKVEDKAWMKYRREEWKQVEPFYIQRKKKDLAILKKYFLKGDLSLENKELHGWDFKVKLNLFDFLTLHPSSSLEELSSLRGDYLSYKYIQRGDFSHFLRLSTQAFVSSLCKDKEGNDNYYIPFDIDILFKAIFGDVNNYGYELHKNFIPFREGKIGFDTLQWVGIWLSLSQLDEQNNKMILQKDFGLEWWYSTLPTDEGYFKETSNKGKLPYVFLALYRICHYKVSNPYQCSRKDSLVKKIIILLDEGEYIEEIRIIWNLIKTDDGSLENIWNERMTTKDQNKIKRILKSKDF